MSGYGGQGGWGAQGQQPGAPMEVPDWTAMAAAHERDARRKRLIGIGAGVAGVVVVAGIVGTAVALQDSGGKASGDSIQAAPATGSAAPSGSAPTTPKPSTDAKPSGDPAKGGEGLHLGPAARLGTVDGHSGPALTLTGAADGYAEAGPATVDTAASFTVSAVVDNSAATDPKAAVSEDGNAVFAFYLGREDNPSTVRNQWVFKVMTADAPGKSVMALSGSPAAAGRWTALTGVYDAKAKTISLYVDGALAKSVPVPAPGIFPANGPVELGRAQWKSHWADFWNGSVADVRVWDHALTAAQIAKPDGPPHGSWLHA